MSLPIEDILKLVQNAGLYRPIVQSVLEAVKSYGPDIKDLLSSINSGMVDLKADCIFQYESKGFTREEAILLTIDSSLALQKAFERNQTKK